MKVLFLSRWLPFSPDNGSKIRIRNILTLLAERHEVALLSFCEPNELSTVEAAGALDPYCSSVRVLPYQEFRPVSPKALAGFLSPRPRFLVDTYRREMQDAVRDEFTRRKCDVVVASQLDMAHYTLGLPGVPALLEELEVAGFREALTRTNLPALRFRALLTWMKLVAYLRRVLPRFGACTVASDVERHVLRQLAPAYTDVHVVPNALDLPRYEGWFGTPRPNSLIYAGALSYRPNYDAVAHFLRAVYPSILRVIPDTEFQVTGSNDGVDRRRMPSLPGVKYTGHLADVRPVVARSWVSVVPLRQGGGTRLKILESMALGTPVVATSKGAEGLEVTDGDNIVLADDPHVFATKVIELLGSPGRREQLATSGLALVRSRYDSRIAGQKVSALVELLGAARAA